ncbi:MAG: ABC transporter ATP-binding protein [Acidobacteriota bacterium]
MSYLEIENLAKAFGGKPVLEGLTLGIEKGEILALLGPSGSGKTTALRLLAGFETPDRGRISVEGEDVTALPPARRNFGMVFQHYALFPHLTAGENVAFGLESRKVTKPEIARRVAEALALVELPQLVGRKPGEMSGGQQQRVAVARALAPEPRVLLLDEPLSNLDPSLRERTRRELRSAIRRVGITTVLVTHEQEEAFHLGDRIAVIADGHLHQVGRAEDLYERPATRFVAGFIGRSSALAGTVEAIEGEKVHVRLDAGPLWPGLALEALAPGTRVELIARPEGLVIATPDAPNAVVGRVAERRYGAPSATFTIEIEGHPGTEIEVLAAADAAEEDECVGVLPLAHAPLPRVFPASRVES